MKDLTNDPIGGHILQMAAPIAAGMFFQTLYFLIDLYFVAHLGDAAIAGVGAAGNVTYLVFALTQVLGVGTVALISHAAGRKDRADAMLVFNQSLVLAATCALLTLVMGYALASTYMHALGSDAATVDAGVRYLYWYLPSLALQYALAVMGSALRGTGIVQPTIIVQMLSVILNAVLAPVLIAGWVTGRPMGVAGAGLASSLAVAVGVILLGFYFHRLEKYVAFDPSAWRPRLAAWGRLLRIGLPAGGEFALMFVFMAVMYGLIRRFGPDAQAGFGVGMRIMQSMFLPAMAVAFAAAPIVGQNFAAGRFERVREAFRLSAMIGAAIMAMLTLLCQWRAAWFVHAFTSEPTAMAVGAQFLHVASWNFVASGFVFTCSALFQGLGNTVPALLSSASRIVSFMIPAFWLAANPQFQLVQLWYVSVASMTLQAFVSLLLVRAEFRSRLGTPALAQPASD
jgi:putative MATE family efflux protein